MYEMHGYAYMRDCPRCTPMCEVHADVCGACRCARCTPMCVVHAYVTSRGHCQVLACERFGFSFCTPESSQGRMATYHISGGA